MITKLDSFTSSYIECALWSSTDDDGEPLDGLYTADDLAESTLRQIVDNCADFQASFADLLSQAYARDGYSSEQAGHDFWLTRNGHGAGFWDRGLDAIGQQLTDMAHSYGSCDLYIGDDGNIYAA